MTKKTTKRALIASIISMLLCVTMLVGTTFAWFTDSVKSGRNKIVAGNLDIELEYYDVASKGFKAVNKDVKLFDDNALWEPGHTEVAYLKVSNLGTLALKYKLNVNVYGEVAGTNVDDEVFYLSDYLVFKVVEIDEKTVGTYTRDTAMAAAGTTRGLKAYNGETKNLEKTGDADYVALIIYMPTTVDNKANYKTGTTAPSIEMGVDLFATQMMSENDSFGNDYDADAPAITVNNTAELQAAIDSAKGGNVIKLAPGNYGTIYVRPTASNGTTMHCKTHDYTTTNADEFVAHMNDGAWHYTPRYTTTVKNLTIVGTEGATVAGFVATSGHAYGDVYDYVRGIDYDSGSAYYNTLHINDLVFKNVSFTGKIDINTSDADSFYNGITFDGCSFTTGGTASANGAAIRYYNEANNGRVKNITVKNCKFNNCYQGVYVQNVNSVSVVNSVFDTIGHNAIALQGNDINLKNVVITGNTFKNISDRVIRFNTVGADSNITIQNNVANNSGDDDGEVIRATSIAAGVITSVKNNSWGAGIVVNDELKDQNVGAPVVEVSNNDALKAAIANGGTVILANDIISENTTVTINKGSDVTIDLNGKTLAGVNTVSGTSALIKNTGTLNITGNGTITVLAENPDTDWNPEGFPTYASNTISNSGSLTIGEGVRIENQTAAGGASYAIDNYAGATLTVNGGEIIQSGGDVAIRMNTASATAENKVVINGGTISGRRAIWIHLAGGSSATAPKITLEINGGNLSGTQMCIYSYSYGNSFANTSVTITGGTFNGDVQFGGGYKGDKETVIVNGGTFNGELGRWLENDGWEDIAKP